MNADENIAVQDRSSQRKSNGKAAVVKVILKTDAGSSTRRIQAAIESAHM